jgi:DNA-binding NarL/FixJ family response regulator
MKARVFVVDDHPIVRGGLAQLINQEADLHVCGEAADAATAFDGIEASKPDVAVVDLSLHGPDGLDLVKNLRARHVQVPVVILSMHDESLYAERALRAGARAYLMKQEAAEQVLVALRRVLAGDIYVSERMASRLLGQMTSGRASAGDSPVRCLSDRELDVFRRIGRGHSTRQIADDLHRSVKTVESYRTHIKEKLGLSSSVELVRRAVEWCVETDRTS